MRDLIAAMFRVAAIAVALIHGVLGETKVFARATIEPPRLRTLIRLVWQAGTVAWIGGGVLLIAAPWMASEPARHWIVAIATLACVFAFAALATPGRRAAGISAGWRSARWSRWRSPGTTTSITRRSPAAPGGRAISKNAVLAALIIVFREVFEAGLIVGIVLAVTRTVPHRNRWIGGGVLAGVLAPASSRPLPARCRTCSPGWGRSCSTRRS
jgi:hypothetical protein